MQKLAIRREISVRTKEQRKSIDADGLREFWLEAIKLDPLDLFEFGKGGRMYLRDLDTLPLEVGRMIVKADFGTRGVTLKFVDRLQVSSKLGRALGDISEEMTQAAGLFPVFFTLPFSTPQGLDGFLDLLEERASSQLKAMVPDQYWEERERVLNGETGEVYEERIWPSSRDMTKVQQLEMLCSFLSRAIRFDPLDVYKCDEGGVLTVKDLRTIPPDVRRLITEIGTDRHGCMIFKFIDKDAASSLLDRVLRICDPTGEEGKVTDSAITIARLSKEIRFASAPERACFDELLLLIESIQTPECAGENSTHDESRPKDVTVSNLATGTVHASAAVGSTTSL